ncbi:MAG: class I SAM-dependent methyltransferase [Deltaproteobacteria bacterium]|nr:class I SAM-dependent methyltransferase [Deltaproteobacteria bacterium]
MDDYYQQYAQEYFAATVNVDPAPFLQPLARRLPPGAAVLDVGCGSGRDLRWLAERGFKLTGFELVPGLAARARAHAGCPVIVGDFRRFNFAALDFDALLSVGSLVHLGREEFPGVFRSICRALVPGGLALITMKEGHGTRTAADGRVFTLWSPPELEKIFAAAGFAVAYFSRDRSLVNTDDVWLTYVLREKTAPPVPGGGDGLP